MPGRPPYGPPDALDAPRYTGPRTFARCPYVSDPSGVGVGVLGVPFDTATSFRAGPRFGPEALRAASALMRPWHATLAVDVFAQSVADLGDLSVVPGNAKVTMDKIVAGLHPIVTAGTTPLVIGGDHSIVLGELRAYSRAHGPTAIVLLDAHADCWDQYYGESIFHGTPLRRAVEEGVLDPSRSVIAGLRGPLYDAGDLWVPKDLGFTVLTVDELVDAGPAEFGRIVREVVGDTPAMLSFDVDVLDPAFAPGTGTPEIGGLSTREAQGLLRSLAGMRFVGYDVVELSPPYDTTGQTTALGAAGICFEMLALSAVTRQ